MYWTLFFVLFSLLHSEEILIGGQTLKVEVVDTYESRAQGLMGRTELPEGEGMLFVYEKSQRLVFWMKNTLLPLSIAFFNADKEIINVLDMDPPLGYPLIRYRSTAPAKYALEVPQGWFDKHKIGRGAKFSFLDPSNDIK